MISPEMDVSSHAAYCITIYFLNITPMSSKCMVVNLKQARSILDSVHWNSLCDLIALRGCDGLREKKWPINVTNQVIDRQISPLVNSLAAKLDTENIRHVFGYGSGVLPQSSYGNARPQIDVMVFTDDTRRFHIENMKLFPDHYSAIKWLGIDAVNWIQNLGAGVYFNPYVSIPVPSEPLTMIKYGIVSTNRALEDLCEWSSMYVAGRLQKPVLHQKEDELSLLANQYNLSSAFNVALLTAFDPLNKKVLTFTDFFEVIALLSYMGDIRMLIGGENPNKVKNIISKQGSEFRALYEPFITRAVIEGHIVKLDDQTFEITLDKDSTIELIRKLPLQFRRRLYKIYDLQASEGYEKEISSEINRAFKVALSTQSLLHNVIKTVKTTVLGPTLSQTLKGIFTAGAFKAGRYAWEKRVKAGAKV